MKALKYFVTPVVFFSSLIGNVYASSPIELSVLSASGNGIYGFFKTIYYLVMFSLILAAAYYVTKFLARKGIAQGKTRTMKLMETMPLGADKSLHLVKVGSQYFLMGSASKNMFFISELEHEKLFEEQLDNSFNLNNFDYENYEEGIESKDFSSYFNSVKNNLNKLKSIVRGNNSDEI